MNSIISVIICSAFLAGITSCQNEVKKTKSKKRIVQSQNSSNKAITQNSISKKSAKSSKDIQKSDTNTVMKKETKVSTQNATGSTKNNSSTFMFDVSEAGGSIPSGMGTSEGTFGTDNGFVRGSGDGSKPVVESTISKRERLNDVDLKGIASLEVTKISLKLIINDRGDVVSTSLNYSDPVSADKVIIENVMREVKKQVKYEIDPGANLVNVYYNVIVKP